MNLGVIGLFVELALKNGVGILRLLLVRVSGVNIDLKVWAPSLVSHFSFDLLVGLAQGILGNGLVEALVVIFSSVSLGG